MATAVTNPAPTENQIEKASTVQIKTTCST
jgi:hypothetical protein